MFYSVESGNSRFDLNRGFAGRVSRARRPQIPNISFGNFLTGASLPGSCRRHLSCGAWSSLTRVNTYSMMYLFNVQRELTRAPCAGNGLQRFPAPPPARSDGPQFAASGHGGSQTSRRPFQEFGVIQMVHSSGNGDYNSLGVKLTRRMSAGFTTCSAIHGRNPWMIASAIRGTNVRYLPAR